jgi:hypothetical protein
MYLVDGRSGSMHGKKFLIKEMQFGTDGAHFYLRVDFDEGYRHDLKGMEAWLTAESEDGGSISRVLMLFSQDNVSVKEQRLAAQSDGLGKPPLECAFASVLEVRLSLAALGLSHGDGLKFQFSLWQGGLPMDAAPHQGWLAMRTTDPAELAVY